MQKGIKIGFVGLGAMGLGMAASLCRAGFAVTGHDLREEALVRLVERGGGRAATPEGAARGAQLLFVAGERRRGRRREGRADHHGLGRARGICGG
jgi:prephenate dehydrogenase